MDAIQKAWEAVSDVADAAPLLWDRFSEMEALCGSRGRTTDYLVRRLSILAERVTDNQLKAQLHDALHGLQGGEQ